MWISKDEALIRGRRLFEARRLLEEMWYGVPKIHKNCENADRPTDRPNFVGQNDANRTYL